MTEKKSGLLKKFIYLFFGLGVLFVLTAIIVPLVVDVDKYRPEIVRIANENINGRLELGKLKLSLWGKILVKVNGVRVFDAKKQKLLSVDDAYFHLPFFSILGGSPLLTFKMNRPEIKVVKDRAGVLNVMTLMKENTGAPPTPGKPQAPSSSQAATSGGSSKKVELPAIAAAARLGIELASAFVSYKDQQTGLSNQVRDFNVRIKDISLTRSTELEIWADLDTRMANTFSVRGPFRITGKLTPDFSGGDFQKASAFLKADFDDLMISAPGAFEKKRGVATNLEANLEVQKEEIGINNLKARFHNAELSAKGRVTLPAAKSADGKSPSPIVKMNLKSNEVSISPWVELVPAMQGYELAGSFNLSAEASGPTDRLAYRALVNLKQWSAKAPKLKEKPVINGKISVTTNRLNEFSLNMKAPGNDFSMRAEVVDFEAPKFKLAMNSSQLDLDRLIDFPPPPKKSKDGKAAAASGSGGSGGSSGGKKGRSAPQGSEDLDAKVAEVRKNKALRATAGSITAKMKQIKVYGVEITNLNTRMTLKNLKASIEQFKMNIWDGGISLRSSLDLNQRQPAYTISNKIQGLDMKKAVESQLSMFKNTVYGKLFFTMNGRGASFNTDAATRKLNVKGNLKVLNATFTSIDVGKMTTEAINKGIGGLAKKYPKIGNRQIKGLPGRESRYERITSDFTIQKGTFNAPNFYARSVPRQGVDLEGRTRVGLIDQSLNAKWKIVDRYNLTKAKDIGVNVAGSNVPHILASGNPPVVSIPVTVTGTLENPKYGYGQVPAHFVKVATRNTSGAAKKRVQAEAKKRVGKQLEQVKKQAPPSVKKVFKKFGF